MQPQSADDYPTDREIHPTGREACRIYAAALKRCAPPANIVDWRNELAGRIGAGQSTVEDWFFGKQAPKGVFVLRLFIDLGQPFVEALLDELGMVPGDGRAALLADLGALLDHHGGAP